jgi:hypothetical protein
MEKINEQDFLIGRVGTIRNGDLNGHFVKIEPSGEEAFLIYTSGNRDFTSEVYDNWVEEKNLQQYFKETGWVIDWIELKYSEALLSQQLSEFPKRFQTVFALACTQRLFSSYQVYDPINRFFDGEKADSILNKIWEDVLLDTVTLTEEDLKEWETKAVAIESEISVVEDTLASIAYTLKHHVHGDLENSIYPARRETDMIFSYLELNFPQKDAHTLETINAHPLMQKTLERQTWDLLDLRIPAKDYVTPTIPVVTRVRAEMIFKEIERVRARATTQGKTMIDWKKS